MENSLQVLVIIFAFAIESYINKLSNEGFALSHIKCIIRSITNFCLFLNKIKVKQPDKINFKDLLQLYLEQQTKKFEQTNSRSISSGYRNILRNRVEKFLCFLNEQNVIKYSADTKKQRPSSLFKNVLDNYIDWSRIHRGLKESSLGMHRKWILKFSWFLQNKRLSNLKQIQLSHLDEFIQKQSLRLGPCGMESLKGVLRGFFRYLYRTDKIKKDLSLFIVSPRISYFRPVPVYVSWEEIEQLLSSAKQNKRDYTIMLLLKTYGLRAGEIAHLKLQDIDFGGNRIVIKERKNRQDLILPITDEVSKILKEYLSVRPKVYRHQEVFLCSVAPVRPLSSHAVSQIIRRYLNKLGFNPPTKGAHLFRHSLSKHMLDQGAPITSIGSILGHSSIRSTFNYTRVGIKELREVADNYANLL